VEVSIVIVNYNVKYFLEQCFESIYNSIGVQDLEIIVVDNASQDGSVDWIKASYPLVKIIANSKNVGFGVANNMGIALATGEYILLLNPDTFIEESTIKTCIDYASLAINTGGIGVKMIDGTGHFLPESKRGFPSPWVAFCKLTGLNALFGKSKTFGQYHLSYLSHQLNHEVAILAGAFMFIPKKVLDVVGGFDESFFMYGEDIDLSYRITKFGFKNYYLGSTKIIHYKGESTKKGSLNYVKLFYTAMSIFATKHLSKGNASLYGLLLNIVIVLKAFTSFINAYFLKWLPVIIDFIIIYAGLFITKVFWENNIKTYDTFKYPAHYHLIILPLYTLTWIVTNFFTGVYDKPYKPKRLSIGIMIGAILIAAGYAFFPEDLRFSRAVILLGSAWAIISSHAWRFCSNFIWNNKLTKDEERKQILIIGSLMEADRIKNILNQYQINYECAGVVDPYSSTTITGYLNSIHILKPLIKTFEVNEIIFCAKDCKASDILNWMDELKGSINFKIISAHGSAIIGSNSKNTAGDVYSIDQDFKIATSFAKRNKLLIDYSICFIGLLAIPIFIYKQKFIVFLSNWWGVIFRTKTWVGFAPNGTIENGLKLPTIPTGVFSLANLEILTIDQHLIGKINIHYAKKYSVYQDLTIFCKSIWHN
jgi:GT2 family glycosyltransferase